MRRGKGLSAAGKRELPPKRVHRFKANKALRQRPKEGPGSAKLSRAESFRRRYWHLANARQGGALDRIGPDLSYRHGHETSGAIQNESDFLGRNGPHRRPVLVRRFPRFAQSAADSAWLVWIKRLLRRSDNGFGRRVTLKHTRPRKYLGNVQHRPAGAKPGKEERKSWETAQHLFDPRIWRLSLQHFPARILQSEARRNPATIT